MKHALIAASAFAALLFAVATASAQDFRKSYPVGEGTSVSIGTLSGDIRVAAYSGADVVVTGRKVGRDADRVQIRDRSEGGRIEVDVDVIGEFPRNDNNDASVNFDVQVPTGVKLRLERIRTLSGDIDIVGVSGAVEATTMSGNVRVTGNSGVVEAKTMSGDVIVDIDELAGEGDLSFETLSGDVDVRLPANAGAVVSARTLSGTIENDFGLNVVRKKNGPGQSLAGTIGDGSRRLRATSMSGDVRLRR